MTQQRLEIQGDLMKATDHPTAETLYQRLRLKLPTISLDTEEGNWDLVGNNTPVFFLRDPLKFPDLNHAVKRDPRTNLRSAKNNWDFWTSLPEALHQVTIVMSDRGIPAIVTCTASGATPSASSMPRMNGSG